MPTNDYVRLRVLRIIDSVTNSQGPGFIKRRDLIRRVGSSYAKQADDMIGLLLSEGVLISFGTGQRSDPVRISKGKNYPIDLCPYCHQRIPSTSTI